MYTFHFLNIPTPITELYLYQYYWIILLGWGGDNFKSRAQIVYEPVTKGVYGAFQFLHKSLTTGVHR